MIILSLTLTVLLVSGTTGQCQDKGPVFYIEVDGIINPATAKFITDSIDQASEEGGQCLIIELDTPGGLMDSMRNIVKKILASNIPIIVYVAPQGARAASAGVFITLASHVAVMAPGTNIGAAHPVTLGAEGKESKTMTEKIVNDTVSQIKTIAKNRGKNVDWAEKAVRKSVSITEDEALKLNVIDLICTDLNDLLSKVDGRVIKFDGMTRTLLTKGVQPRPIQMSWRYKLLDTISNPIDRLYPPHAGNLRHLLRTVEPRSDPSGSRRWDFPHPGLLCPADAADQFCRFGIDPLRHHSLHCGGESGQSRIVDRGRGHLTFSRVHDAH